MKFVTVTLPQKKGLPMLEASTITLEQRAIASGRHRILGWTATSGAFATGVSGMFDLHWPRNLIAALWLTGIALISLCVHLVHRHSHELILAAARTAAQAG